MESDYGLMRAPVRMGELALRNGVKMGDDCDVTNLTEE